VELKSPAIRKNLDSLAPLEKRGLPWGKNTQVPCQREKRGTTAPRGQEAKRGGLSQVDLGKKTTESPERQGKRGVKEKKASVPLRKLAKRSLT